MSIPFRPAVFVAAVTAALTLAACGSSDDESSSGNAAATSTATAKAPAAPAGNPIKVGFICSCSGGAVSKNIALSDKVPAAWEASVNAAGGINGHPVKVIIKDDESNPAKGLQVAKELVEGDKVMAVVGVNSLAAAGFAKYLADQGVPVVGGGTHDQNFISDPNWFPSGGQVLMQIYGDIALAAQNGKKHMGVMYCAEAPSCADGAKLVEGLAKGAGMKVSSQKVSSTAPNYTAPCLAFKKDGVDAFFPAVDGQLAGRLMTQCAQQGFKPQVTASSAVSVPEWTKNASFQGGLVAAGNPNTFDTATPAVKEFRDALDKYSPGVSDDPSFNGAYVAPWAGGKLFEVAAKAADLAPDSTPAEVKKGLYALKGETLGGLSGPITFTKDQPTIVPCYFSQEIKDGSYQSLDGNEATCLTPAETAKLLKGLGLA